MHSPFCVTSADHPVQPMAAVPILILTPIQENLNHPFETFWMKTKTLRNNEKIAEIKKNGISAEFTGFIYFRLSSLLIKDIKIHKTRTPTRKSSFCRNFVSY